MSEKDPVDKNMINRLREYAAPYQPDAWDDFEKFREKKKDKRRPVIFFFRFAAGIAVLFFAGWGVYEWAGQNKPVTAVKQKTVTEKVSVTTEKQIGAKNKKQHLPAKISGRSIETTMEARGRQARRENGFRSENSVVGRPETNTGKSDITGVASEQIKFEESNQPDFLQALSFRYTDVHLRKPFIPYVEQNYVEEKKDRKAADLRYSIGLFQNSNRASHVLPEINFGLNGTTEIPLSRKIDFSTGLYVGRQSLRIQVEKPAVAPSTAGTPQLDQVDYRWVSLELPLHLRYSLSTAKKMGVTFAGGMALVGATGQQSDYLYENKRTITTLAEGENGPVVVGSETIVETSVINKASDRNKFDTGAALNFSVGLTYPVNRNLVAIEPFIKYPVGSITAGNLNFMTWGLQMRWSAKWYRKKQ